MSAHHLLNRQQKPQSIIHSLLASSKISRNGYSDDLIKSPANLEINGIKHPNEFCSQLLKENLIPNGQLIINQSHPNSPGGYQTINQIIEHRNSILSSYLKMASAHDSIPLNDCWRITNVFILSAMLKHQIPKQAKLDLNRFLYKICNLKSISTRLYSSYQKSFSILLFQTKKEMKKHQQLSSKDFEWIVHKFTELQIPLTLKPFKDPEVSHQGFFDKKVKTPLPTSPDLLSLKITEPKNM